MHLDLRHVGEAFKDEREPLERGPLFREPRRVDDEETRRGGMCGCGRAFRGKRVEREPDERPPARRRCATRKPRGRGADSQGLTRGRRRLRLEQPRGELVVIPLHVAAADQGAAAAVHAVGEGLEILAVEDVGLRRKRAGHPLPGEMVARRITIEQVLEKPVGPRLPADAPHMHEPAGQPHPFVVVEPPGVVKPAHEGVDALHVSGGRKDVFRHAGDDAGAGQGGRGLDRLTNPVAKRRMHLPPVVAPAKFRHELRGVFRSLHEANRAIPNFRERDDTVPNPRREARHRAGHVVAGAGVGHRVDRCHSRERRPPPAANRHADHARMRLPPIRLGDRPCELRHEPLAVAVQQVPKIDHEHIIGIDRVALGLPHVGQASVPVCGTE